MKFKFYKLQVGNKYYQISKKQLNTTFTTGDAIQPERAGAGAQLYNEPIKEIYVLTFHAFRLAVMT
jgi:hypothetical protein